MRVSTVWGEGEGKETERELKNSASVSCVFSEIVAKGSTD